MPTGTLEETNIIRPKLSNLAVPMVAGAMTVFLSTAFPITMMLNFPYVLPIAASEISARMFKSDPSGRKGGGAVLGAYCTLMWGAFLAEHSQPLPATFQSLLVLGINHGVPLAIYMRQDPDNPQPLSSEATYCLGGLIGCNFAAATMGFLLIGWMSELTNAGRRQEGFRSFDVPAQLLLSLMTWNIALIAATIHERHYLQNRFKKLKEGDSLQPSSSPVNTHGEFLSTSSSHNLSR
jgi:hypothetical protein